MEPTEKTIKLLESSHPNPKIPRKKVASQSEQWTAISERYSTQESQQHLLTILQKDSKEVSSGDSDESAAKHILLTHLKTKQSGYRSQDTIKGLYDPSRFIQMPDLINLLASSNLSCFYCRKWATLFYENVRDPRQWSLERLSNAEGHNRDNVVIACLECNMRRRTMYYERYIATKQLKVNKIGASETI